MEIVVVGCRGFGKVHLRSIRGMDISIVETDTQTIDYCKENFEIKKVYGNLDEALRSDAQIIDLVVPHTLHKELAIKSIKKGKNVLLEKPLSTSVKDGEEIIMAASAAKVKFMVAEQYFFDPAVIKAKQLTKEGKIGRVHSLIVRDQRHFVRNIWKTNKVLMGGGALIDGGIHYVETILDLGGDYHNVSGKSVHGGSTLEGEDTTYALFDFTSGATGILFYSWAYQYPPILPGFEIIGAEGSIYEDVGGRSLEDFKFPSRKTAYGDLIFNGQKLEIEKYDVFVKEISEFAKSVELDTDVPYPPQNALRNLRVVEKIYGSKTSL
ncbi:MAG: Gfo/Idh/MocA family oxidoreductase [Thermoplasmataceae archaeon]